MTDPSKRYFRDFADFAGRFCLDNIRESLEEFDLYSISMLRGAERDEAVALLIAELEQNRNDPRIPPALKALNDPKAVPVLQKQASIHNDETAVASAQTLWDWVHDPAAVENLIRILRKSPYTRSRDWAAMALRDKPGPTVTDALLDALSDRSDDVKTSAIQTLPSQAGWESFSSVRYPLGRILARLYNPLRCVRKPALAQIREWALALRKDATPDALGLMQPSPEPSDVLVRFRRSVFGHEQRPASPAPDTIDVAAYTELTGEELQWAQQFLLQKLGDRDVRAVQAVAALQATWAIPALEELVSRYKDKAAKAAQAALQQLVEVSSSSA